MYFEHYYERETSDVYFWLMPDDGRMKAEHVILFLYTEAEFVC